MITRRSRVWWCYGGGGGGGGGGSGGDGGGGDSGGDDSPVFLVFLSGDHLAKENQSLHTTVRSKRPHDIGRLASLGVFMAI